MRKIFTGIVLITIFLTAFLFYNHKQLPDKEDVFKITKNWSQGTEEVYLVRKIGEEWLTIYRDNHSITVARLEQNWLGYWDIINEDGSKTTISTIDYHISQSDQLNWSAGSRGEISHYFGQIINPDIKKIEVETQKTYFEDALIINSGKTHFFYNKTNGELVLPVNIRGLSESGKLIYSTLKPIKE